MPLRAYPALGFLYRTYMRILCWYTGLRDRFHGTTMEGLPVPPASLRYRVHGFPNLDSFLQVGKQCSRDIEAALAKTGKGIDSFKYVLDFGCGCARTLRWFADRSRSWHLYGTDIDADAISWCRNNLGFASFGVNRPLPPLEYPNEMFDLIFAVSVFTHLDEDRQFAWRSELKRIARSQAIILITLHGHDTYENLPSRKIIQLEQNGFVFIRTNVMRGLLPEWYQVAYHTKEYVLDKYSKEFTILNYISQGMNDHQDIVILQRA